MPGCWPWRRTFGGGFSTIRYNDGSGRRVAPAARLALGKMVVPQQRHQFSFGRIRWRSLSRPLVLGNLLTDQLLGDSAKGLFLAAVIQFPQAELIAFLGRSPPAGNKGDILHFLL
jgi:hypothetical protein